MLSASIPPFDDEDVAAELFCEGWDSACAVLHNPAAHYHAPEPGHFRAYDDGFTLALNTPFTFGLADMRAWEQARTIAGRRRKLRAVR
jgi:hypothetical protein